MGQIYVSRDSDAYQKYKEFVEMFNDSRFFLNEEHEFIEHYLKQLSTKIITIRKGESFYRGRINLPDYTFSDDDLHSPPKGKASAGRINPKGISFLYTSADIDTVIAEVQPWLLSQVTIAQCTALKDLKIVDLMPTEEELYSSHSYQRVISEQFSRPFRPDSKDIEYLPTQYISEYFQKKGVDGVRYGSAVHQGGKNLAFFNPDLFKTTIIKEVSIYNISFKWSEV